MTHRTAPPEARGAAGATRASTVSSLAALDADQLSARLLALLNSLDMNGDRLMQAMDTLDGMGGAIDPWSAFRADGPVAQLAGSVPLPAQVRTALEDPAQIFATFRAQLALCSNGDLPAAVADLVNEFCGLADNERFSALLDRLDSGVSNVRNSVNSIRSKVDDILGQLPTADSCKFFCGSEQ